MTPALTDRQWEILRLVAQGKTGKVIAAELHCAESVVKYHLTNVYRRLGLHEGEGRRTQAAVYYLTGVRPPYSVEVVRD